MSAFVFASLYAGDAAAMVGLLYFAIESDRKYSGAPVLIWALAHMWAFGYTFALLAFPA